MIPIKECLDALIVRGPKDELDSELKQILADEVNVLEVRYEFANTFSIELDTNQNEESLRRTQKRKERRVEVEKRKALGLKQDA